MPIAHENLQAGTAAVKSSRLRTRALIILNRKARCGSTRPSSALDRLEQGGFELIDARADLPTDVSRLIRENKYRVDAVIIGGGDGTLSQAADGLVDADLPLGILPMGTANDLARTLGVPTELDAAADVIVAGHRRRIDLGWVNGTHFFNVASIGLGTGITRRLSRQSKSRWGVLAYLFAAAQVLVRTQPFRSEIRTANDVVRVRTVQIAVGNGRHYGGGMTLHEDAQIDDELLHLVSIEVQRWWHMLPLIPALRKGSVSRISNVRILLGREFEVRLLRRRRKRIMADGELAGRTPAHFKIVPRALSVFAPPPANS
jgi:YegS/Rv2252/BmrU family lipid kinase